MVKKLKRTLLWPYAFPDALRYNIASYIPYDACLFDFIQSASPDVVSVIESFLCGFDDHVTDTLNKYDSIHGFSTPDGEEYFYSLAESDDMYFENIHTVVPYFKLVVPVMKKWLNKNNIDINSMSMNHLGRTYVCWSLLMKAVYGNYKQTGQNTPRPDLVKLLLLSGAKVNVKLPVRSPDSVYNMHGWWPGRDDIGRNAFSFAIEGGNLNEHGERTNDDLRVPELLLRFGADIDNVSELLNETPLYLAIYKFWPVKAKFLLEKGADTSVMSSIYDTAYMQMFKYDIQGKSCQVTRREQIDVQFFNFFEGALRKNGTLQEERQSVEKKCHKKYQDYLRAALKKHEYEHGALLTVRTLLRF